jgi:hypothetical protein
VPLEEVETTTIYRTRVVCNVWNSSFVLEVEGALQIVLDLSLSEKLSTSLVGYSDLTGTGLGRIYLISNK